MKYIKYQNARDLTLLILREYNISRLPVIVTDICTSENIICYSYVDGKSIITALGLIEHSQTNDGFSVIIKKRKYIFYNEACSNARIRFTIAHELGHHCLGHTLAKGNGCKYTVYNREPSSEDNEIEQQANVFASRLLAPACVLWGLNIHSAEQIAKICNISFTSAKFRLERMNLLYEREKIFKRERGKSCFLLSPLEREVFNQFTAFIKYHE